MLMCFTQAVKVTDIDKHRGLEIYRIGLHHPLDGVTNPEYKLLLFLQLTKFNAKSGKH